VDKPSQKSPLLLLSLLFYVLASLLFLLLVSAFFALPTATLIGKFFFQSFGLLSLYLPLYLYVVAKYLDKKTHNFPFLTLINLSFLPFITLVLFLRFLGNKASTEWELALFWQLSKNDRTHFSLLFIVALLLQATLMSYFWYASRRKKSKPMLDARTA
jgi:hypothetical protein